MKTLCLLPLLAMLVLPVQNPPTPPADESQIAVLSFKWSKSRQTVGASESDTPVKRFTHSASGRCTGATMGKNQV